jgi:hypothetical protein
MVSSSLASHAIVVVKTDALQIPAATLRPVNSVAVQSAIHSRMDAALTNAESLRVA